MNKGTLEMWKIPAWLLAIAGFLYAFKFDLGGWIGSLFSAPMIGQWIWGVLAVATLVYLANSE